MADEYIRKQDVIDDLHTQLMYRTGSDDMKRRLDDWVKTLPSVDAVPVVRCKDCKSCCRDDTQDWYWCERGLVVMKVRPDTFCSYGKRKE